MSDAPLTQDEIGAYGTQLRALELELEASLEQGRAAAQPVTLDQSAVGRVSRVDAIQQQQMAQASRRRARSRLEQVRAALRALGEGAFGECRRCEEPIGRRRLDARPESPVCVRCQEIMERRA